MDLSKEKIEELNTLSKEVYGAKGRWRTIMKQGRSQLAKTESGQLIMPKHVGHKGKVLKHTQVIWDTVESIEAHMRELKTQKEAFMEKMKNSAEAPK